MKKIKYILTILILTVAFNVSAQKELITIDKEDIKLLDPRAESGLKQGMASFVENLKPFYRQGMSYNDFVTNAVGRKSLKKMPIEGVAILKKAYTYLSANVSYDFLVKNASIKEYGQALFFIENQKKVVARGVIPDAVLFGGTTGETFPDPKASLAKGGCRWWQLACHLNEIFGEEGGSQVLGIIINFIKSLIK